MKGWIVSGLLIVVFVWMWPIRLFTNKSNCYFWTLEQLIFRGGRAEWHPSRRWIGLHVVWIATDGTPWEYTLANLNRNTPWYKLLIYNGIVRRYRGKRKVRR